jgi:hypothetical protein
VERQRLAWQDARQRAVDELVEDNTLTMPQKLSRLAALKTIGFYRNTAGMSVTSDVLFDQAKGRLLTSKCSGKSTRTESSKEVNSYASLKMKYALAEASLTEEERHTFLGKHDGSGKGFENDDDDDDEEVRGEEGQDNNKKEGNGGRPSKLDVNDDGFDIQNHKAVRRVRRPSVVKQDINAGMIANDAMRLAVLELKKMLVGGPVAEAHVRLYVQER